MLERQLSGIRRWGQSYRGNPARRWRGAWHWSSKQRPFGDEVQWLGLRIARWAGGALRWPKSMKAAPSFVC